jgi:AbrB family looped-hinge helix DNA binding protein
VTQFRLCKDEYLSYSLGKMQTKSASATRLTSKGQVVIPKAVRDRLGWKSGAVLRVVVSSETNTVTLQSAKRGDAREWLKEIGGLVMKGDPVSDLENEHRLEVKQDARRRS